MEESAPSSMRGIAPVSKPGARDSKVSKSAAVASEGERASRRSWPAVAAVLLVVGGLGFAALEHQRRATQADDEAKEQERLVAEQAAATEKKKADEAAREQAEIEARRRAEADQRNAARADAQTLLQTVIAKVKPSLVSISVHNAASDSTKNGAPDVSKALPDLPKDSPLHEFFKSLGQVQTQGSGFLISADGYVVTTRSVIGGATKIQVSFDGQEMLDAEVIGTDQRTDLALLKIKQARSFPFVALSSEPVTVGDWALAAGDPNRLGSASSAGVVSALERDAGLGPYLLMQIDMPAMSGRGGPTFNSHGDVVGINIKVFGASDGAGSVVFALPVQTAAGIIHNLRQSGTVSRGWLGVKIQNVDADMASALGLAEAAGAVVSEIMSQGPADGTGLKAQDAILAINGEKVVDSRDLARKIADRAPGDVITLRVWSQSEEKSVKVTLGTFPDMDGADSVAAPDPGQIARDKLGLTFAEPKEGRAGVEIGTVDANFDASTKGIKTGDIIVKIGGVPVASAMDIATGIEKAIYQGRTAIMLQVESGDAQRLVPVQLKR